MQGASSPALDFLLRLWFERAGSAPLGVTMNEVKDSPRLFGIVAGHSDRFQRFSCDLPLPANCSLDVIRGRVGQLRTLQLSLSSTLTSPFTAFSQAPSLRSVELRLSAASPIGPTVQIDLPWAQLTELCVSGSMPNLLQTLESIPGLEVLELPAVKYSSVPAKIHLNLLRVLRCQPPATSGIRLRFLASLACPSLEMLELAVKPAGDLRIVLEFMEQTSNLRSFTAFALSGYQTIKMLANTPKLQRLALRSFPTSGLWHLASPGLAPDLRDLEVQCVGAREPYAEIRAVLKGRSTTLRRFTYSADSKPLTDCDCWLDEGSEVELVKHLREAGPQGCQVTITAPRIIHIDSKDSWTNGRIPLYCLNDTDYD